MKAWFGELRNASSEHVQGRLDGWRLYVMRRLAQFVLVFWESWLLHAAGRYLIAPLFRLQARVRPRRRILFAGQAYYNAYYLSRALRDRGWRADVLNWSPSDSEQIYFHGEDIRTTGLYEDALVDTLAFYMWAIAHYDVFHFSNAYGIQFGHVIYKLFRENAGKHVEIYLLKLFGRRITYANNGCLDGVSQSSYGRWGEPPVCAICRWQHEPKVCSDERNLEWGEFRNRVADYQCMSGGNRVDYNDAPSVHEVPEFYCLDERVWRPDLVVPEQFRLADRPGIVRLYHSVGNLDLRTNEVGVNIKSSHVYLPLIRRFENEGLPIELISLTDVPNIDIRYYQAQADIFLDMLSFGWFGATAREALMLGKVVVCYLRPVWLESIRREIPGYVDELPVVSATPDTVEAVLRELIEDADKRAEIGRRSRAFALKWHSREAAGVRLDAIFSDLLRHPARADYLPADGWPADLRSPLPELAPEI